MLSGGQVGQGEAVLATESVGVIGTEMRRPQFPRSLHLPDREHRFAQVVVGLTQHRSYRRLGGRLVRERLSDFRLRDVHHRAHGHVPTECPIQALWTSGREHLVQQKVQHGLGRGRGSFGPLAFIFCLGFGRYRSVALEPRSLLRDFRRFA